MFGCHVDDILSAAELQAQQYVGDLMSLFDVGTVREGQFRLCGLEIAQSDSGDTAVSAKGNAEKIRPVSYNGFVVYFRSHTRGDRATSVRRWFPRMGR